VYLINTRPHEVTFQANVMAESSRIENPTALLLAWQAGDEAALSRLVPLVYQELRRVARARLGSEAPGHLLQTTALVHEAYLRLVEVDRMDVRNRAHLLALAARLMRQVLVDHARRRKAFKRGGDWACRRLHRAPTDRRHQASASRTDPPSPQDG
jgi:RNA polymerase sigma factor (TIGR02999 family)